MVVTKEKVIQKALKYIRTCQDVTNPRITSVMKIESEEPPSWFWEIELIVDWTYDRECTFTLMYSIHGTMYSVGILCPKIRPGERMPRLP
uniref:Uncharacterized protein n=1 Tax=viral metagenome TaxID=1070528 RepID=A0A6M3MAT0_9ZZZZ